MVNLVTKYWWREIPIILVVIEGRLTRSSCHYHVWGLILFCVNVPINSLLNEPRLFNLQLSLGDIATAMDNGKLVKTSFSGKTDTSSF